MSLVDTILSTQQKEQDLTKQMVQDVLKKNASLLKDLKLTPVGSPIGPKRPQESFRFVRSMYNKGYNK